MFTLNSSCVGRWFACLAAALSLILLAALTPAHAQTTWIGNVDQDWNNAANWDNGVPNGNDAFVGSGAALSTSADVPNFNRLNLQNRGGLLTIGHAMTLQRLDDTAPPIVANGESGHLRVITGGNLTLQGLPGDPSGHLFFLRGFSELSTATVDGGSITTTDPALRFRIGGPGNQDAIFTLNTGSVDIAGQVAIGSGGGSSKGRMDLNGGTFTYAGSLVVEGNRGGGAGGELNIAGATVLGTGGGRHLVVAANTIAGDHGLVNLTSGSLELGLDNTVTVGPGGSFQAPPSTGRFVIAGGEFQAPGELAKVFIHSHGGSPTSTGNGIPTASHGALNQSGGTALIEGELRIGHGPPISTTGGFGAYVHRGGDMTVSNLSGTGLLRVAIRSEMTISGGAITADTIQIDAPGPGPIETGGFLQGAGGTLVGPVNVGGTISPGFQASFPINTTTGTLNIHGNLTLASTAATFFDFKNPTLAAGTFDSILNDGTDIVSFDGALTLRFFGGEYQPGTVAIFDNFAGYSGNFDSLTITGLTNGEIATFNPANGTLTIAPEPPPLLPGDYNVDGFVAAADYVVWRKNVGADGLPNRGPFIRGPVGQADYDFWRQNFGAVAAASGSSATVPEPDGLALLLMGVFAAMLGAARVRPRHVIGALQTSAAYVLAGTVCK